MTTRDNPDNDSFIKGMVHGYQKILDMEIEPDYVEESNEVSSENIS